MIRTSALTSLGVLGVLVLAGSLAGQRQNAAAGVIYRDDFEASTISNKWSSNAKLNSQHRSNFTQFNGRYTNEYLILTLTNPPPPGQGSNDGGGDGGTGKYHLFTLTLDFYCLDSWDGEGPNGRDRFVINANNAEIFDETFSNVGTTQSFRKPDVGPTQLGFDARWNDTIYRKIKVDFTVAPDAPTLKLMFNGTATQGINDESWGIDNIEVSYQTVPAPGAAALAAVGMACLAQRRRRGS